MFEVKVRELGGRIGKLVTRHGNIETPFLFPVVDPARQVPNLDVIRSLGFSGFITNAYLFFKRNKGAVKKIHKELSWNDVIMTDSGGYQILVYGDVEVDNKTIVTYQKEIETDVGVILDVPTGTKMSWEAAARAVEETYRRGIEALPLIMDSNQLWVYPVQGAPYRDLVIKAAIQARKLPYDIYAVGSPTVLLEKYKYSKLIELVAIARLHLPPSKPLHVFGVGHPMIIPFLVAVGGDLFDSASYILYARNDRYMLETGTKDIKELEYFLCNCQVCSRYEPREVLELPSEKRVELLAIHNLHVLIKELKLVKQAIKEGRLWELLEYRSKAHPSLHEAFEVVKKYAIKLLEKYSSTVNPGGRALLLIDLDSEFNPRVKMNVRRALQMGLERARGKLVVLIPAYRKPYNHQTEYVVIENVLRDRDDVEVFFIHPILGLIMPRLSSTYPYYQHETRITSEIINPSKLVALIKRLASAGAKRLILIETGWLKRDLYEQVQRRLKELREAVVICKINEISSLLPPSPSPPSPSQLQ